MGILPSLLDNSTLPAFPIGVCPLFFPVLVPLFIDMSLTFAFPFPFGGLVLLIPPRLRNRGGSWQLYCDPRQKETTASNQRALLPLSARR
jgi:hypothetical protein